MLPTTVEQYYYPTIRKIGIAKSYADVKITYLSYFAKKLYSLDNGITWLEYSGIIKANAGDVIQAKAIDKNGNETEVSTYTVKGLTDNLDDKAFDKDQTTSVTLSSKQTKSFNLDNVDNEVLRIYTTGKVNTGAYIKLYDKENQELSTVTLNTDLTIFVIPEGSVKASIYSGTSTLTINEVNLREVKATKENYPEITINDANWTTTKAVEILYPEGTEREYSLDLGTTWNKYTNELTIEKETTIFARSIKEGKIILASSFVITKVDNVDPMITLEIPDEIPYNSNYSLPTSYIVGASGGEVNCKVNDVVVTNTKELHIGNNELVCSITNGVGINKTINKTINVLSDAIYDYIGKEETYQVSKTGRYLIETWGAQGADATEKYIGGYGGYSSGEILLNEGEILYINVGGMGGKYTYTYYKTDTAVGGYNGGGYGYVSSSGSDWVYRLLYAGGGATHIALKSGLLSTLEENKDSILIVSGGGGSGSAQSNGSLSSYTKGGSGGGISGGSMILVSRYWTCGQETSNTFYGTGGTQENGGVYSICGSLYNDVYVGLFGQGALAKSNLNGNKADWGGGGGFYGGSTGAGGSGYIGNTLLTNKSMYCYNCEESSEESTKTIKTTNVSETPTSKYAKIGNGYARITYIGE